MSTPYRMLAVDLDGTLTTSEKRITPTVLQSIHAAQDAGIKMVLATGRPTVGAGPVADQLGFAERGGYVICNNGARIMDWKTKEILEDKLLPRSAVDLCCRVAREYGVNAICYDDEQAYSENPSDPYVEQERFNNSSVMNKVDDLAATITWETNKVMVVGEATKLQPVFALLKEQLAGYASVIRSDPFFAEIVPEGTAKDIGLMKLGGLLGIPRTATIAVGDSYNDVTMLDYAGLGIAMGNAYDDVKTHANWIAPTNDEDGVATVIEHFILRHL